MSSLNASYPSIEDYVEYISNYINFTLHYKSPTNNWELYQTCDCSIKGPNRNIYLYSFLNFSLFTDYGIFDFIIIGGGTSGSVLANRLSEVETWNILLLEAGKTENDFTDIPAMTYYLRSTPMNWGYFTKPQKNSCLGKHFYID